MALGVGTLLLVSSFRKLGSGIFLPVSMAAVSPGMKVVGSNWLSQLIRKKP